MVNHPIIAAIPTDGAGAVDKEGLRAFLITGVPYTMDDGDDPEAFDPRDTDLGLKLRYIIFDGRLFELEPSDSTSAHDGSTVLVTSEGSRYLLRDQNLPTTSVIDKDLATPPGSPMLGDRYLVPGSPTGAWVTKTDYIATYTAQGWVFAAPVTGRLVYVIDETAFYHYSAGGAWTAGIGSAVIAASSVALSKVINFGQYVNVQNQTTDTPPGSPSVGEAYIIGPSPTGDWVGHASKVAICEVAGTFAIYTPAAGMRAYDISLGTDYQWNGTLWLQASGDFKIQLKVYSASDTWIKPTNLMGVRVHMIGSGGGGAGDNGNSHANGTSAADTSFGAHIIAGGGVRGTTSGGAGGTPSGPFLDYGVNGNNGSTGSSGSIAGGAARTALINNLSANGSNGAGGAGTSGFGGNEGGGGSGCYATGFVPASALAAAESVTIGAVGSGAQGGQSGSLGWVIIEEYIRI